MAKLSGQILSIREKMSSPQDKALRDNEKKLIKICLCTPEEGLAAMASSQGGLSSEEASTRLGHYGPNELTKPGKLGFWADMLERLRSPLVVQLLAITTISTLVGEYRSAIIVGAMILLSVGLSFILDRRSAGEIEALGKRVQSRTYVLRDGTEQEIKTSEVVPGDIVLLQAGSSVPADLRLIAAKDFFLGEAALTGESMPVEKTSAIQGGTPASALHLTDACFMGTSATSGTAKALVVNTGAQTLYGALAAALLGKRETTSFDKGLSSFTWLMIRTMVVMVAAVFLIVGLSKGNWIEALLFALSVAVGLTPEMLPMIVTVNLAKGALSMAKKKVIVKRLPSIQNLGAVDILCTDKTGTLTQDKVMLEHHVDIIGHESEEVLNYAYLNSHFQTGLKNLLDRAVLEYVDLDAGTCRLIDELPFDFQRRRMSVVVEYEGDNVLICKGAVEEIFRCCTYYQIDEDIYPLLDMMQADLFEEVEKLNREGFRVLGIAYREFPKDRKVFVVDDESQLVLLGYIAFMDPPKDSAAEAIQLLGAAGVRVKVLTGDNGLVSRKVCQEVGIAVESAVSGEELARLSPEELAAKAVSCDLFYKLTPSQKEGIVKELKRQGHIVGFMGDGINDTSALKAADVGISVDSAVDVAKESADIILLEKSLLALEEGIMEGRRIFANIIKYIRMGSSSNFGNMFSMLGASVLLPFLPMKPIQILANNFLYDLSQTGIPMDKVDSELIAKPISWDIKSIKRFMVGVGPVSSLFDYATFALMWFFFGAQRVLDPNLSQVNRDYLIRLFQTGWFVESLLTQTLIVHIIRTRRIPFLRSRASAPLMATTLIIAGIGIWLPYSFFAPVLGLVPLPAVYWLWIGGFLVLYSILAHFMKLRVLRKSEGG
ncbi:MAG: magnesium-translocating P-type ATPase [Spirochaetes bacterium]|nr:magnesium-translocating P-type ATPase [Spirochaetota bacterium]